MFTLIFSQMLKMLFIMLLALICYRIKLVNQEGNRSFSNLLLLVVNPCLIITVYQVDYDAGLISGLLLTLCAAFAAHGVAILAARFFIREKGNPDFNIERFTAIYSNCGFIGIPLINSILGSKGVFYLSAYITVFNLLVWTHGLGLMKGEHSGSISGRQLREILTSPMILATAGSLILFFLQIRLPQTLLDAMTYVADMNTPLAMMVAGFSVAQTDFKKVFHKIQIYKICILKLLVIPLTVLAFLSVCRIDRDVAYTVLVAAACPSATTATMMAIRYNRNYTYASEIFSFTTVLSIITVPAITFIAGFLI